MFIPRYWSRGEADVVAPGGRRLHLRVWRGSRTDTAEAQALADEAVQRMAARVRAGEPFPQKYTYGDRPLREEVVREIGTAPDGGPDVAITRNVYGALVLNAARVFFIDVDLTDGDEEREAPRRSAPSGGGSAWGMVEGIFGRSRVDSLPSAAKSILEGFLGPRSGGGAAASPSPAPSAPANGAAAAVERLRRFVAERPGWRVRVYRTQAGLRYLVTHALFRPDDAEARDVMQALGADPQYVRLCAAQKSFRARLTPKPWRIGVENPPVGFPYEGPGEERAMRDWERRYEAASAGRATCRLLEEIGDGEAHPEAAAVAALHDEQTRATSNLPLA
ncbi:MAG TPA: hypothetical protein VFQ39_17950 [Longimicrobium sp.]|nr:hypothetical protein [Longimicrobium sp.]